MFGKWPTRIFVSAEAKFALATSNIDNTARPARTKIDIVMRDCRSCQTLRETTIAETLEINAVGGPP